VPVLPVPVVPGFFFVVLVPVVPEPVVLPVVPVEPLPDAPVPDVEELDEPPAPPAPEPPIAPVLPPTPMPEPLPALPVPPVPEPPVPEPVESVFEPEPVVLPEPMPEPVVLPEPMPPVLLGVVPLAPVPLESVIVPEVVSGDFAGSLLPPQATTLLIASAVKNAYEIFMGAPEFFGERARSFDRSIARSLRSLDLRARPRFQWSWRRTSRIARRRANHGDGALQRPCPRHFVPSAADNSRESERLRARRAIRLRAAPRRVVGRHRTGRGVSTRSGAAVARRRVDVARMRPNAARRVYCAATEVGPAGLEPATYGLKVRSSTD
jgi:hypothetical protein